MTLFVPKSVNASTDTSGPAFGRWVLCSSCWCYIKTRICGGPRGTGRTASEEHARKETKTPQRRISEQTTRGSRVHNAERFLVITQEWLGLIYLREVKLGIIFGLNNHHSLCLNQTKWESNGVGARCTPELMSQ